MHFIYLHIEVAIEFAVHVIDLARHWLDDSLETAERSTNKTLALIVVTLFAISCMKTSTPPYVALFRPE